MKQDFRQRIAILGSTGSIGTQALEIIDADPEGYCVYGLSANTNVDKLIEQALHFHPKVVCLMDESKLPQLRDALKDTDIQVLSGESGLSEMVQADEVATVLAAMVGYAGLKPTIDAIKAGKAIALANKETLVVAGELIMAMVGKNQVDLKPVDSEHSAIYQCMYCGHTPEVEKILLTASGGPFRTFTKEQLKTVTPKDALKHPNWNMGAKITIDSATMMNKGFEVIEAKWLFHLPAEKIEVIVHPQSIIHSAVQFCDGSIIAQLGLPDMKLPIHYAFCGGLRMETTFPRADLTQIGQLTFEKPDMDKFPCLGLAFEATKKGGNIPCVMNAANEVAVAAFLKNKIGFTQIPQLIEKAMNTMPFIQKPTYEDYVQTNKETRLFTESLLNN